MRLVQLLRDNHNPSSPLKAKKKNTTGFYQHTIFSLSIQDMYLIYCNKILSNRWFRYFSQVVCQYINNTMNKLKNKHRVHYRNANRVTTDITNITLSSYIPSLSTGQRYVKSSLNTFNNQYLFVSNTGGTSSRVKKGSLFDNPILPLSCIDPGAEFINFVHSSLKTSTICLEMIPRQCFSIIIFL